MDNVPLISQIIIYASTYQPKICIMNDWLSYLWSTVYFHFAQTGLVWQLGFFSWVGFYSLIDNVQSVHNGSIDIQMCDAVIDRITSLHWGKLNHMNKFDWFRFTEQSSSMRPIVHLIPVGFRRSQEINKKHWLTKPNWISSNSLVGISVYLCKIFAILSIELSILFLGFISNCHPSSIKF